MNKLAIKDFNKVTSCECLYNVVCATNIAILCTSLFLAFQPSWEAITNF